MKQALVKNKAKLSFVRGRILCAKSDDFTVDTPLEELQLTEAIHQKQVDDNLAFFDELDAAKRMSLAR